ncbi:MAG: DUF937 domain-containing protein [Anaerovoracaceae bacterium]|jgi:hypothetical protein|nr:DUF937 domain-containing protein [Anaerovoracaceae bacterium]
MDIFRIISDQILKDSVISKIGKSVGVEPNKVEQIVRLGMPTILQALGRNASTSNGKLELSAALDQHQDDKIGNIEGFLDNVDTKDGLKILGHAFQDKNGLVQNNLAKKVGLEGIQVSGILALLAPLLMGILGQEKKKQNVDAANIPALINSMLSPDGEHNAMDMFSNLLDSDKDGDVMDDLGKIFSGLFKK